MLFPDGPPTVALEARNASVTGNTASGGGGVAVGGGGIFTQFAVALDHVRLAGNAPDDCAGC
jgi:hypothetical protein